MVLIGEERQRQRFCIMEVGVGDAALDYLGIIFHGMVVYQKAVFVNHITFYGIQFF